MGFGADDGDHVWLFQSGEHVEYFDEFLGLVMRLIEYDYERHDGGCVEEKLDKMVGKAAKRLKVSKEVVKDSLLSLGKLLLDCAKHSASRDKFVGLMKDVALSTELKELVWQCYRANEKVLRAVVESRELGNTFTEYRDARWRLDVEISSRLARGTYEPKLLLYVDTSGGQRTPLQIDYATLSRVHDELQTALDQSKSVHSRRIMRYIR
mmetsp:Transcript_19839/g.32603  ORF Transcript_19839/g.32603 Transcript_19839/m.32603 type:complete len:209 (+) Transcript_19839:131-757(+)